MIISLFGPDGVGKSTVADALRDIGVYVISGTGVASWPDQSWHNELTAQGLHEPSIDDPEHFLLKIEKLHTLARTLERQYPIVMVDSDPFHKTWMFDMQRGNNHEARLWQRAGYAKNAQHIHVYLRLSATLDTHEQAVEIQRRMRQRGVLAPFDPTSVAESQKMIETYDVVARKLVSKNERVITVYTDRPFDAKEFQRAIEQSKREEIKMTSPIKQFRDPNLETSGSIVGFYPREFYVLDNFAAFQVDWRGRRWPTSEHAYQAAHFFDTAPELVEEIWNARSSHDAYKIAHMHTDKEPNNWADIKIGIMEEICRCKLEQNDYVQHKLLQTLHEQIVEDSPIDSFWGWGPDRKGRNELGKIWMRLRDELQKGV